MNMQWQFEDYEVHTSYTDQDHTPIAFIKEFFALTAMGVDHKKAISKLRIEFDKRIQLMKNEGRDIPAPGSPPEKGRFAPSDRIEALRPFIDEFWREVLGTSYETSFVSNLSTLQPWEQYVGGREQLIKKVLEKYGVDISGVYEMSIPDVFIYIRKHAA
jgi:hypothetical protein